MPIKIVVTGPESTGKTTLCTQLSDLCKGTMIPEFSRSHLKKTNGLYQLDDIEYIGFTQNKMNVARGANEAILFCDTDALTSHIWVLDKYHISSSS